MKELTIRFDTEQLYDNFVAWLCNGKGEEAFRHGCECMDIPLGDIRYPHFSEPDVQPGIIVENKSLLEK